MRVLVIGANGYIASRAIPVLLAAGHEVMAGVRDISKLDNLWWRHRITPVEINVLEANSVVDAVSPDTDAVVYLVHGMASDDFADADRKAAEHVHAAVNRAGVSRVVYVSGIIPPVAEDDLSDHLRSRHEVEELLSGSTATVVTLRAAMVLGAGSTSFELMEQLAERLPVTVIPDWMQHRVEPIAIVDLAHAILGALDEDLPTQHFDIGGGEPVLYPELISEYLDLSDSSRLQVKTGLLPEKLVAQVAAWITDIPSLTVKSLMESLEEDMVAADRRWIGTLVAENYQPVSNREALIRSMVTPDGLGPDSNRDPMGPLTTDQV